MKTTLAVLLLSATAFGQNRAAPMASACGPDHVTFSAYEGAASLPAMLPEPGKALVYFIQDYGQSAGEQHYTLRIGVDGAWVGAYKNNSAFTISVVPGEHHVCASVQSNFSPGLNLALAHFTAEAGGVYYFRTRFLGGLGSPVAHLNLDQPDSDEAKYLIATYPPSYFKPKK